MKTSRRTILGGLGACAAALAALVAPARVRARSSTGERPADKPARQQHEWAKPGEHVWEMRLYRDGDVYETTLVLPKSVVSNPTWYAQALDTWILMNRRTGHECAGFQLPGADKAVPTIIEDCTREVDFERIVDVYLEAGRRFSRQEPFTLSEVICMLTGEKNA